ncbi:hypothetical protein HYQ46_010844 [Verticillium longisporum]|nr:hypothetical protein HYQ46_010844 [Verticillium longisporum]
MLPKGSFTQYMGKSVNDCSVPFAGSKSNASLIKRGVGQCVFCETKLTCWRCDNSRSRKDSSWDHLVDTQESAPWGCSMLEQVHGAIVVLIRHHVQRKRSEVLVAVGND